MKSQKLLKANTTQIRRARQISAALILKGLEQKDVAEALGITQSAISLYVNGFATSKRFNQWVEKNLRIKI